MSAIIGALRSVLSLDSAAFETGAKRAQATMGDMERRMVRMGGRLEGAGRKMALGLTLPLVGAATVAVKSSLQVVDAQAKMAQSMGTTVASMQVLERAADLSGVSMGEVNQATIQLTKRLSDVAATGKGPAADALKRLHLRAQDLQKLPLDQRLIAIQDALAKYVPEAERATVATGLFGTRAGITFTRIDSAALRVATDDVKRFGIAVSEADADQIERTNDAISRLGLVGRGVGNQLAVGLAPSLEYISDKAADAAEWFNGLGDRTKQFISVGLALTAAAGPAAVALGLVLKAAVPLTAGMVGVVSAVARAPSLFAAATRQAVAFGVALGTAGKKAVLSGISIKGVSGALGKLKGALLSTGIGALVVGAGYLAMKFHELVTATGGWGMALQALGDLAEGVWEGIKTSAQAISPALKAVWQDVKAGFLGMMGSVSENWSAFLTSLAVKVQGVPGMSGAFDALNDAAGRAFEGVGRYDALAQRATSNSAKLKKEAASLASQGWEKAAGALKTLSLEMDAANAELDEGDDTTDTLKRKLQELGDTLDDGSGGGTAGKLKKTKEAASDLAREFNGAVSSAVDGVARSFGDWLSNGFRDFRSFWDGMTNAAKRGMSDLAATFASNKLQLVLGVSTKGAVGTAAGNVVSGGGGSGSGLLGGFLGNVGGGLLSGVGGGVQAALGLGGYSSAGLFSIGANAATASAVTGASGLMSTIGAALPAIGAIAAGVAVLAKGLSQKYAGTAIRGTLGANGFEGSSFDWYRGGFLRGDRADYKSVPAEIQATMDNAMRGVVASIETYAGALDLNARKIRRISGEQFTVWTNGKTEEEIAEALNSEISGVANEMAALVLGTDKFTRSGETALDALTRLSTGLSAFNDMADLLGHKAFATSLRGADMASELVDLFGGAEAMTAAAGSYFGAFYSEGEQSETILRRLREKFAELNLVMPESKAGFRQLVEGVSLNTTAGRELYVELLSLSGAMDEVLPQVTRLTLGMSGLMDQIDGEVGAQIETARDMAADARAAADLWYKAGESMRAFLGDLVSSDLSAASSAQAFEVQRNRFEEAIALVRGGDVEAAQNVPELARAYLQAAKDRAGSALEYRRIAAEVQGQVQFAAGIADLQGSNADVLQGLYEKQIEVLTNLGAFLQLEGLTDAQVSGLSQGVQDLAADWDGTVAAFEASLGALETAIRDAEAFSYDDLVGRLDVAVALAHDAPSWLQKLVGAAETGIRTTLDFVIRRDDLTPDMRWMAVNAFSEHVTALDFVVRNDLTERQAKLALATSGELLRDIRLNVVKDIPEDVKRIALAEDSRLSRLVNVSLTGAGDNTVRRLNRLRDMIGGTGTGKITFDGGISFSATEAFRTLFSDTASKVSGLGKPMSGLTGMLDKLRAAVRDDIADRKAQSKIAALNIKGADLKADVQARKSSASSLVGQIAALEASTGAKLARAGGKDAILKLNPDGTIAYQADFVSGSVEAVAAFREAFHGAGGLEEQIFAVNAAIKTIPEDRAALKGLRQQVVGLGGIPAFAAGGDHLGGWRVVGERGWELENTGPSRIVSHSDSVAMLDNRQVVQALDALARMGAAQGQKLELLVRKIAQVIEDWDEAGQPEVRA